MTHVIPETPRDYDDTRIIERPDWIDPKTGGPAEESIPRLGDDR